jgi:hypothetical protein
VHFLKFIHNLSQERGHEQVVTERTQLPDQRLRHGTLFVLGGSAEPPRKLAPKQRLVLEAAVPGWA